MARAERFEDLKAWQKARELTRVAYRMSTNGAWAKDYGLRGQIQRAAVSAMSNIAEGFERRGDAEFHHSLSVAKGSAGEVRSQLYVALDQEYINAEGFESARKLAEDVSNLTAALIRYLKAKISRSKPPGDEDQNHHPRGTS